MSENSKIEWTDHTFNPWWGCVEVSPACDNCYARTWAKRTGHDIWGKEAPRRFFSDKHWREPEKWNLKAAQEGVRRRVFCGSMCDVMEDRCGLDEHRERLYDLIDRTQWLDWLLLSKRPQNFFRFLPANWMERVRRNVWLMTTVESPDYFWRIRSLKVCPAVVHGLSIEPMLAPMPTLNEYLSDIEWVIAGGESGGHARVMYADWVRSVRNQCKQAGVAFHFKQWGEFAPVSGAAYHIAVPMERVGKKSAGRLLDAREWNELPKVRQ